MWKPVDEWLKSHIKDKIAQGPLYEKNLKVADEVGNAILSSAETESKRLKKQLLHKPRIRNDRKTLYRRRAGDKPKL